MKNQAAYLVKTQDIQMKDLEMPSPAAGEVLVEMKHVGICGSDIHFYQHGRIGRKVIEEPFILGHECCGVVTAIGGGVTTFVPGDTVVLEPGVPCGKCAFCKSGKYNLCPDVHFLSAPPDQGAMRRYMTYPAEWCYKLPKGLSTVEGAMVEPFAVGLHAAERAEVEPGKTVAILGAGCIGLMTLIACKAYGADHIVVTDVFDTRLEKAATLGADKTINVSKEDLKAHVMEATGGLGVDLVFETAGSPRTALQAIDIVKRGGVIMQVGNITEETPYIFNELSRLEVDIRTVFRYRNVFPTALQLMEEGKANLLEISPVLFPFKDTTEAFACAVRDKNTVAKTIVSFEEN